MGKLVSNLLSRCQGPAKVAGSELIALIPQAKERLIIDLQGGAIKCSLTDFMLTCFPVMLVEFILTLSWSHVGTF